jgi:hypothetical protein
VRIWLRRQPIVRAFIDRRVRLSVRITESQIVQHYQDYRQMVKVPLDEAVREQIRRFLTESRVDVRLPELIEELCKKGNIELPPYSQSLPG